MIKTLDVTLRDGGYRNNFHFNNEDINHIVASLTKTGIDYIEVGYRNGSFKPMDNIGITGNSDNQYLQLVKQSHPEAQLGVIYHPRNIKEKDIDDMFNIGISLLRCCFDANNIDYTLKLIEKTKQLKMVSCVNFTRVSQLSKNKLLENAALAVQAGADVVYLADSNGSLLPHEVTNLMYILKNTIDVELGFHAHNNLNLAIANAIAAIDSGATFIDSSLRGMGKGAGNLQTEFWIAYLLKTNKNKNYDLGAAFESVEYLANNLHYSNPETPLIDIMAGSLDLSIEEKVKLNGFDFKGFNELFKNKHNKY